MLPVLCTLKGVSYVGDGIALVCWQTEIGPVEDNRWPGWRPSGIQVEAKISVRVGFTAVCQTDRLHRRPIAKCHFPSRDGLT
jgi:hypothetical protein